jgi:hypothetical protein
MAVVGLSVEERNRLDVVMAVMVPLMIPGTLKAALERPITGPEALCLLMAGAGGRVSDPVCIYGLKQFGFSQTKANAITKAGVVGLKEAKLAERGPELKLTTEGMKVYKKIHSNLKALESAKKIAMPEVPKTAPLKTVKVKKNGKFVGSEGEAFVIPGLKKPTKFKVVKAKK